MSRNDEGWETSPLWTKSSGLNDTSKPCRAAGSPYNLSLRYFVGDPDQLPLPPLRRPASRRIGVRRTGGVKARQAP